jgi:glycosyltransferase involved in cell wall biosynthesis
MYSVCITTFNCAGSLRASLESILGQVDESYETVVVDNYSTDGTTDILREMEGRGLVKLVVRKCFRGAGRQAAYENSSGDYIIDQVDMDDIYLPLIRTVIDLYHEHFEGFVLLLNGLVIIPRKIVSKVGGWHDLQWGEDTEFYARVAKLGLFRYLDYEIRKQAKPHGSGSTLHEIRYRYEKMRDLYRLGKKPWRTISGPFGRRMFYSPLVIAGYLGARFMSHYEDDFVKSFRITNCSVDLEGLGGQAATRLLKAKESGEVHSAKLD